VRRAAQRWKRIIDRRLSGLRRPHPAIDTTKAFWAGVSFKTAAEILGVSPNTIRKFVADGKLPAYHVGDKLVRFDPKDLDHFLASRRVDNS
jgi:excisionase family DNA binding protein